MLEGILSAITFIANIFNALTGWFHDRQVQTETRTEDQRDALAKEVADISNAATARDAVRPDSGSVVSDPDNRGP